MDKRFITTADGLIQSTQPAPLAGDFLKVVKLLESRPNLLMVREYALAKANAHQLTQSKKQHIEDLR